MRILDLFCGAGGASMGMFQALPNCEITGVDINQQPLYPFNFVQADAVSFDVAGFDFIWASPPCQAFTKARKLQGNMHPNLIHVIRDKLMVSGVPFVIENVPGAPLINPVTLCGSMFGLSVYRHRLFETNFRLTPKKCSHSKPQIKMGRPVKDGDIIQVVGHFSNVPYARKAMGIDWMGQKQLAQAIPPAYSKWIIQEFLAPRPSPSEAT